MSQSYKIIRCTEEYYPQLLTVLDTAFGGNKDWFTSQLSQFVPYADKAELEQIEYHWLALDPADDKKAIGVIGTYPFTWQVGDGEDSALLDTMGIGQVGVLPEYQGQGVMGAMLRHAYDYLVSEGKELAWLQGFKDRYKHFGYDFRMGNVFQSFYLPRNVAPFALSLQEKQLIHVADDKDIPVLNALYQRYPSFIHRNERQWSRLFTKENLITYIVETKAGSAYISYNSRAEKPVNLLEVQGDPKVALGLLEHHISTHKLDRARVASPFAYNQSSPILDAADSFLLESHALGNIVQLESLYGKLKPFAEKQLGSLGALTDDDKHAIIKQLLGYIYQAEGQKNKLAAKLNPLTVWTSQSDAV